MHASSVAEPIPRPSTQFAHRHKLMILLGFVFFRRGNVFHFRNYHISPQTTFFNSKSDSISGRETSVKRDGGCPARGVSRDVIAPKVGRRPLPQAGL
jgi:hypothetical protein